MHLSSSDLLQSLRLARVDSVFIDLAENAGAHLLGDRRGFMHLCVEGRAFINNGAVAEPIEIDPKGTRITLRPANLRRGGRDHQPNCQTIRIQGPRHGY